MGAFDDMRAALFADGNLSEAAAWSGVPGSVRIQWLEKDQELRLDRSAQVKRGRTIQVQRSQVPAPAAGDLVNLTEGAFKVIGTPQLEEGVWTCELKAV